MRGGPVAKFGLWFALAICIGIFFADYAHRSAIRSVQQRRDALETEFKNRLPAGTDRFHVFAILDEKGIRRSGYEEARGPLAASVLGAPAVIGAQVPVNTFSLTQWSIHFVFRFDDQGHYINCTNHIEGTFY